MKCVRSRKITFVILLTFAVILLITSFSGICHAYFTTYVVARGGRTVHLQTDIKIREDFDGLRKIISIDNKGEYPCWVRIRAITPKENYEYDYSDGGLWAADDNGYWYYKQYLPVGGSTSSPFTVGISNIPKIQGKDPTAFNIVVIGECIPVTDMNEQWNEVDWNQVAKVKNVNDEEATS